MSSEGELGRIAPQRLEGNETFRFGDKLQPFDVHDFWAWAVSDLISNATRGVLAEYIVAKACGVDTTKPRDEWAPVDLVTSDGISVEVKSAAYVQSWYQDKYSKISLGIRRTRKWDPDTSKYTGEPHRSASVYVFALLAHKHQSTINPLNLDQWEFYVLPTCVLDARERSQHSITLPSLKRLNAGPYSFVELAQQVRQAAVDNRREH